MEEKREWKYCVAGNIRKIHLCGKAARRKCGPLFAVFLPRNYPSLQLQSVGERVADLLAQHQIGVVHGVKGDGAQLCRVDLAAG